MALFAAAPAQAQATRTWISGVGSDSNPCSRTAPCKTWAGAIIVTAAGGEVDCLDPGGFGTLTITKAITLDCGGGVGGQVGSILASSTNGITINAGPNDKVEIRNLSISGEQQTGFPGIAGIRFNTGAQLTVDHVMIIGFGGIASTGPGIDFEPSVAGSALIAHDIDIRYNLGPGIFAAPVGGVAASAVIDGASSIGNSIGLQVKDGATVTVLNSNISANSGKGVVVLSTTATATANLFNTVVASNTVAGVQTSGTNAKVTLSQSGIYNNGVGISAATGSVVSFTNNAFGPNAGNAGAATSTVAPQ
ncbi:MAG TPA: right-handed parallel beta-helix repeat-containing protein [Rhizomicrobium sp.]|nr:right-handed parallel beta-helix repeat-containing protein [Rhizomicrobium sp.]